MPPTIFDFITKEANSFETDEIQVGENMLWSFRKHVQMIFHLKNGYFYTGANDFTRAFRNIMQPILDLAYWTEDLEVKDVLFYAEGSDDKVLSFLIKKYHDEVYVKEHNLDILFDQITESDIDYGGVIVQKGVQRPEIIQLQSVAFCDQTDILGGAIGFKHYFSPNKLREMAKFGWGDKKNGANITIEELITLATADKEAMGTQATKSNKVPTKTIECYIVRGNLPEAYLEDNNDMEYYCNQLQIVAFYTNKDSKRTGVTLYRKKADTEDIMFHTSKEVFGRALGQGVGETLIPSQVWTNYIEIHKMMMLQAGAKSPLYTDDGTYTQRNKIDEMENNEITTIEDGKRIYRVPTLPTENIQLYSNEINALYAHAQLSGAAFDPLMGKEAASGTTFRGQERVVAQGKGTHDKRRGQRAKFIESIYQKWILPDMVKEIKSGKKFLASLSLEELTWVAEQLATKATNDRIKEMVFSGKMVTKEEQEVMTQLYKETVLKKGNKQLIEILEEDFEDIELKTSVSVAGKSKNLADLSDKLLSIFQFAFQDVERFKLAMQNPAMAQAFSNILEFSGMSIANFNTLLQTPTPQIQNPQETEQVKPLALTQ